MQLDLTSKRAQKLIAKHGLTEGEIQQIVASARINLATFDPEYRANVSQIADELQKSRPTLYGWADRALAATIEALRQIRTGRPPKVRPAPAAAGRPPGKRKADHAEGGEQGDGLPQIPKNDGR